MLFFLKFWGGWLLSPTFWEGCNAHFFVAGDDRATHQLLPHPCLPRLPPILAFMSFQNYVPNCCTPSLPSSPQVPNVSSQDAQKNFKKALEKGLLKILSKMGISLLSCYHGAQIFEVRGTPAWGCPL